MDLQPFVDALKDKTAWQRTPAAISDEQYLEMIIHGIEYLFMLTGRDGEIQDGSIDREAKTFAGELGLTEKKIVGWAAEIELLERVRDDKNAIVGYTTDALSVTNADKPYQYLTDSINYLKHEIRVAYYKLVGYVTGE